MYQCRSHAFALDNGDRLFVGGCDRSDSGPGTCPVFRLETDDLSWHQEGGHWTAGVLWASGGWSELGDRFSGGREYRIGVVPDVDLTGDGVPEMISSQTQCGAHTCFVKLWVLTAEGSDKPHPALDTRHTVPPVRSHEAFIFIQGMFLVRSDGGLPFLRLDGGLVGSAGAGDLQRAYTLRWKWDPQLELVTPVRHPDGTIARLWYPSDQRIFRFHDALIVLDADEPQRARQLLREVITGTKLRDWPGQRDRTATKRGREQLAHYAWFVLARIALEQGASEKLRTINAGLSKDSPALAAIEKLQSVYEATWSMAIACAEHGALDYGEEFVFQKGFGNNQPFSFGPAFTNGLCSGLDAPARFRGHAYRAEVLQPGYVRYGFEVSDPDDDRVTLEATVCHESEEPGSKSCESARLNNPTSNPFQVDQRKADPRNFVIWRARCDRLPKEDCVQLHLSIEGSDDMVSSQCLSRQEVCGAP